MNSDDITEDREFLAFVREGLEGGETISPAALARLSAARQRPRFGFLRVSMLVAATLAVAAVGWLLPRTPPKSDGSVQVANVIALLQAADAEDGIEAELTDTSGYSLADTILAWQDAPAML